MENIRALCNLEIGKGKVILMKQHRKNECYCEEYQKKTFTVRRIEIYEMKETEEMKEQRIKEEEQERQNDIERWEIEKEIIEESLEEITKMKIEEKIFDSEIHKWSENDSEFDLIIKGRKNVI